MKRDELDLHLLQLAKQAQQNPPSSYERRIALTKLIDDIVRFGNLCRPQQNQFSSGVYQEIYDEARQELFLYICQSIDKYEPERGSVLAWVNVLFERRFFKDTIRKIHSYNSVTKMSVADLDNFANPEESKDMSEILKEFIELDPHGIFRSTYVRRCPQINFREVAIQRFMGKSWQEIASQYNVKIPTVSSFYQRCLQKFSGILQEYCINNVND
jgi:DNA-directed RNA polymerase specialized sigma24 family protein